MKLLAKLFLWLSLATATAVPAPALAETKVVHVGADNSVNSGNTFVAAYDAAHTDYYVVQGIGWGVDQAQTNIASILNCNGNCSAPELVTIDLGMYDAGSGAYVDAAAWVSDLYSLFASIRSGAPGVKIAVFTLGPRTGDTTYTNRRQAINDALRKDEGNGTGADWIIDIAANPKLSSSTATSDTNIYTNEASITHYVTCTSACGTTTFAASGQSICYNTATTGTKGHDYLFRQYACAMESMIAGKYPWTVYEQPVVYSSTPVVPSSDPPFYTLAQPADIATSVSLTGWTVNDLSGACSSCFPTIPPASEFKMRTQANGTHVGRFDPVRNPRQTIAGHCHAFFGNNSVDANSTYTSLRSYYVPGTSAAAGGPINATAYWVPCVTKDNVLGTGLTKVKKINSAVIYYVAWRNDLTMWDIPRALHYVFGTNMDDPNNLKWKAEIPGFATWTGNGFVGWFCDQSGESHGSLTNYDGSDRFTASSGANGSCPTSHAIYMSINGPGCLDGVNLRSTDGYNHTRVAIQNNNTGKKTCPDNFYAIPQLQEKIMYTHLGSSDYTTWTLDSDAAATTASVAQGGSVFRRGESAHGDWLGAWDYTKMQGWMHQCVGSKSTSTDNFTPHECNNSVIASDARMIGGFVNEAAPDGGRNPQVDLSLNFNGDVLSEWWDLPATSANTSGKRGRARIKKH